MTVSEKNIEFLPVQHTMIIIL